MKITNHFKNCSTPICQEDPNPNFKDEVIWVPGESICRKQPYQKFQLQQLKINDRLRCKKYKKVEGLTANELEGVKIV